MTYQAGQKVQASDYNTLITTVNSIFGIGNGSSGYGGFSQNVNVGELPTKNPSDPIVAEDWYNLRYAYLDCAEHQDVPLIIQTYGVSAPTYTTSQTIVINTIPVTLTGSNAADARDDINAAAIPGVTSDLFGSAVRITSTVTLTLAEGSGTALADLGFDEGTRRLLDDPGIETNVSDIIKFFTELLLNDQVYLNGGTDLRLNDDSIVNNQTSYAGETFSPDVLGSTMQTSTWAAQVEHRFSVTFDSQDDARAFFNSGGTIRLFAEHSGTGLGPPNEDQWMAWYDFLEYLKTIPDPRNPSEWFLNPYNFDADDYFNLIETMWPPSTIVNGGASGAAISNDGYINGYDSNHDGPGGVGPYDVLNFSMLWRIYAVTNDDSGTDPNGGNGDVITIRSVFVDNHVSSPDLVSGTLTSLITSNTPIGVFPKSTPVYASIFDLG